MQLRTIALAVGTAAVLVALVVLFFRVRATQEVAVPEDALARARAQYQRQTQAARPAPDRTRTRRPTSPARPARSAAPPAPDEDRARPRAPVLRASPRAAASGAGDEVDEKREAVRDAYDHGDYVTALEQAEEFLGMDLSRSQRHRMHLKYVRRVAAVAACALGEEAAARKHYDEMDRADQRVVSKRCERFGFAF